MRDLLRRCLAKDRKQRLRDIGDARLDLLDAAAPATLDGPVQRRVTSRRWLPAGALMALAAGLVGLVIWQGPTWFGRLAPASVVRLSVNLPGRQQLNTLNFLPSFDISPDGTLLAYAAREGDRAGLFLRRLDRFDAELVGGSEGAAGPFFSFDGRWVAFFAGGTLKKVPAGGGPVETVCAGAGNATGGTWTETDELIFGADFSGLRIVPAGGGPPLPLTEPDSGKGEVAHIWPCAVPGNRAVLFSVQTEEEGRSGLLYWTVKPDTGGGWPGPAVRSTRYLPTGHLLYQDATSVLVAPFDLSRLERAGEASAVLETPYGNTSGRAEPSRTCGVTVGHTGPPAPASKASRTRRSAGWTGPGTGHPCRMNQRSSGIPVSRPTVLGSPWETSSALRSSRPIPIGDGS